MSQGFRKGNKRQQVSQTTGITPPTRIDQNRNTRRAQQINHLHQEFQDLKQKIKEVQNKNEKIIQKIHKAYNFKKKSTYTEGYMGGRDTSPVIHYQNKYDPQPYSAAISLDAQSNKSYHSSKGLKSNKKMPPFSKTGNEYLKNERFNQSMEYGRSDPYEDTESMKYVHPTLMEYNTSSGQALPPHPNSYGVASVPRQTRQSRVQEKMDKKIFEQINLEKQNLEQDLIERDNQIYNLQSQLKGVVKNAKKLFEGQLDDFVENYIQKNMNQIQKTLKKYQLKLKNLKKLTLLVKDKNQDRKSSRILSAGRQRRSHSRSRIHSPIRDKQRQSLTSKDYSRDYGKDSRDLKDQSKSRSRIVDMQQKNKKQFQEIADKYEEVIKSKIEEIERWDKKYRVKERQCYELKMRVQILQKRLSQEDKKSKAENSFSANSVDDIKIVKKFSVQSNLLMGLEDQNNKQVEALKEKNLVLENDIRKLKSQINEFQTLKNKKSFEIQSLNQKIAALENKNKNLHQEYQDNLTKAKQKLKDDQQGSAKEFQIILNEKNAQIQKIKNLNAQNEKKMLQKECENFSLESKLKKIETMLENKDKKIEQLEKLTESNNEDRGGLTSSRLSHSQYLQKSIYLSGGQNDLKKLKDEIEKLQQQLQKLRNENYELTKNENFYKNKCKQEQNKNNLLVKEFQGLKIQNQQLKIDANMNNISVVEVGEDMNSSGNQNSLGDLDAQERKSNEEKIQEIRIKYEEKIDKLEKEKEEWYEKYVKMKNFGLQNQSKCIKMATQLQFLTQNRDEEEEEGIEQLKKENESLKKKNTQLIQKIALTEEQMQEEKDQYQQQLDQIQKKWAEFQQERRNSTGTQYQDFGDLRSSKSSIMSYNLKGKIDHIHTQNQYLTVKLKEAQAQIETQKIMQKKVIEEYKLNMEESKKAGKLKDAEIEALKDQIQDLHRKIADISLKIQPVGPLKGQKENQRNQMMERIQQLQLQLKQTKQYTKKMSDMEEQLFEEIKIKEEETAQLYAELKNKEDRIRQLEQLADVREMIPDKILGSHISTGSRQRQSLKSQSSLKYSSHTRVRGMRQSQRMHTSNASNLQNQLFDLDLSEAGESFFEQPSQVLNISQIFEREQIPYQKMKIKRQEQVKLFEKTATYIKSLKRTIQQKNKRIKILQKKIQSLKSSELVRKQIGVDVPEDTVNNDEGDFKDYESVQLQYRRGQGGYFRKYKQLENDTKLVMQENNMLIHQIESLEEELLKAQEQENSLVKIKDLYKEEIKKLIKKNEEQTKSFEEQLRNQKKRVEDSESVHNIQALKQLFIKIIQVVGIRINQGDNMGAKKKEQKRKQIEQYVKVMANILKIDKKTKQGLLVALHK